MSRAPDRRSPAGRLAAAPPEQLLPLLLVLLLAAAAISFFVRERAIARTFGFPLDGGWLDLVLGRDLVGGPSVAGAYTDGPVWAALAGAVVALAGGSTVETVAALKLAGLLAFSLTGLAVFRIVRSYASAGNVAMVAATLFVPLSAPLVWAGTSGLGLAWGVALAALGIAAMREGRPVAGTVLAGSALGFTPAALAVLLATLVAARERIALRVAIAAGFVAAWLALTFLWAGPQLSSPTLASLWAWPRNWLALVGLSWPIIPTRSAAPIHPPILLVLAAFGAWRTGRDGLVLVLAAILPAALMGLALAHPGVLGRLVFVALPPLLALAALGLENIAERAGERRGSRIALAVLVAWVLWSGPALWRVRDVFAWQVENASRVGTEIGGWIGRHAAPGDAVATNAPGAVGWFSRRAVTNLAGPAALENFAVDLPPWVAVTVRGPIPAALGDHYKPVFTTQLRLNAGVYPSGPFVVFHRTYAEGIAAR